MNDDEADLVLRATAGDRAAIQSLLTRHHDDLVAHVANKVPADLQAVLAADDVCQEAYITVFQRVGTLRDPSAPAFRSWLRAIVERKLVDAIRALRAQKRGGGRRVAGELQPPDVSSVVQLLDLVAVHERTPSRSIARREMLADLQGALDSLRPDYRQAVRLHYIDGLSVADTAQRMERSAGAVGMLCNRGLRELARLIGDPARFLSRGA